jgi:hypothetical protein
MKQEPRLTKKRTRQRLFPGPPANVSQRAGAHVHALTRTTEELSP